MGEAFVRDHQIGDDEDIRAFRLGAVLAQDPNRHAEIQGLNDEERLVLDNEIMSRWSQPKLLYLVIILCSTCAAVQGMGESSPISPIDRIIPTNINLDETVVNGAQIFYSKQFGISDKTSDRDSWLLGLVNSAPYLCCAFVGCWLTIPFNNWFGRRGTIFLTCTFSALACFWQAFTNTWWHMFIARFALGLGIGPKSATVPIYAAECTPPQIRGALVM
jgi:MFS family permease